METREDEPEKLPDGVEEVAERVYLMRGDLKGGMNIYFVRGPDGELVQYDAGTRPMTKKNVKAARGLGGLDRVVIASCSPRLHEPTFKKMLDSVGVNPYMLDMANLREQCSWVHLGDRENATCKAETLVNMSISRVRQLEPLFEETLPLTARALVIGGGIAGIQAALDLADTGYDVTLVEKSPSVGGVMAQLDKTFPTMDCSI